MKRKPSPAAKVLAQAAAQAAETDPVLKELDAVLDADPLYQQVCAKLDRMEGEATSGEVLLRMLLVKHLYAWSEQQTAEQVEDSLVLRWFCRLGMQQAPTAKSVGQAAGQVSAAELEALANRVEQASERAKSSEGRLRPTYRQRWR
jgi:transposase, IS5 family